jgi:TRAP-type mannitol/chloroaromatic compound transport system substrate-binding protein
MATRQRAILIDSRSWTAPVFQKYIKGRIRQAAVSREEIRMAMPTSRRGFLKSSVAGASAAATVSAPAIVRAQQVTTWRCQSMWSAAELTYKAFQDLCERIKANTNGRLVIEPFAASAVAGVFETLDAVGAGVLQAHSSWPGYFSGKDAGLAVISDFVFGYQHPHQAEAWFQHRGGLQMLREAYAKYNVYPIGVSWWGVESIVSKKPIQKMEDFKGVKFRSPQGMTAEILTKLGASIVVLPGGEVFSALDKGVVDAADWATISMNERMGFHSVAKYPTKVFHSMPVQEFSVNIAAWKALPDDIKGILHSMAREWSWDQVQRVAVDDVRVLKELSVKGVKHEIWDDAQMVKMRELATKTWEDWSKKTPLAKQAYDSQLTWLKDLGVVA